jgi:hypothetical protein
MTRPRSTNGYEQRRQSVMADMTPSKMGCRGGFGDRAGGETGSPASPPTARFSSQRAGV